jgi:hypothetical protein
LCILQKNLYFGIYYGNKYRTVPYQVRHFNYLGCDVIYDQDEDVNNKLHKFQNIGLNGKFLRFLNENSIIFLNIFTIFNQLYNFHCLLLASPNVSRAFQFRPCENFLVCLCHIFENAKTFLSTQYMWNYQEKFNKENKKG